MPEGKADDRNPAVPGTGPSVVWDDSKMQSTFANVVNVASSREEISVFFGTNRTWNISEAKEVTVDLSDRMILTPLAAKRLWILLGAVLKQHEQRFGVLSLDPENPSGA